MGKSHKNPGFERNLPNKGGWLLNSGQTVSISTPKDLYGSRFWGRTNCATRNGVFSCETGNCANNVQCAFDGVPRGIKNDFIDLLIYFEIFKKKLCFDKVVPLQQLLPNLR